MSLSLSAWETQQEKLPGGPGYPEYPEWSFWKDAAGNVRDFDTGRILKTSEADGMQWERVSDWRKGKQGKRIEVCV